MKIATAGLAALAAGAIYAFKQFEDSEKISKQTGAVLESTGHAAHVSAGQVSELANAISQKTAIDDEQIQSGENMLLTFKNISNEVGSGNDIFNQATMAITDMSVAMGQDLKSSAIQVGKALNDPIAGMTALQRVGVQFTDSQKQQIAQLIKHNNLLGAQKIILGELSSEFSGSAAAQKTASATMGVALNNLAETVGQVLAPALTVLADGLTRVVTFLQNNVGPAFQAVRDWIMRVWEQVQPLAETIAGVLVPAFETAWNAIVGKLIPGLKKLWDAFGPVLKVLGAAALLFGVVMVAQIALFVTAISTLIGWLGDLVQGFMKVVSWVRENFAAPIVGAIQTVIDWIGRVIGWVRDKLVAAWEFLKEKGTAALHALLAPIQFVIDKIQTLIGWIQDAIDWFKKLFSASTDVRVTANTGRPGVGNQPPPGIPRITPNASGIELHLHGDLSRLVDSVDEGLARKGKSNVTLVHHGG